MFLDIRVIMVCDKIQLGPFDYVATQLMSALISLLISLLISVLISTLIWALSSGFNGVLGESGFRNDTEYGWRGWLYVCYGTHLQ